VAVSPQQLRPISLLDSIRAYLTPELISGASSAVREPESATRTALNTSIPSVLAGLTHLSSSSEGVSKLGNLVREGAFSPVADNASTLFGGGTPTTNMMSAGQQLLGNIFGENSSSVTDMLARNSGIRSSSASSLLGMTAPLVLGVIGKYASSQGLNASGIAGLLRGQKDSIFSALPSGMSQLIGLTGPRVVPPSTNNYRDTSTAAVRDVPRQTYSAAPTVPSATGSKKWLWIGLIALAALLLWMFARGRGPNGSLTRLSLPNGTSISVPEGSLNYNLASYLGSQAQDVPRTFVFDHLNFQTASTELTPDSVQSVGDLTAILKAYPNAHVTLTGHTDNTGDVEANQRLSVDRANAVKAMLVSGGVPSDRISTAGYGQSRPIAANDTDEGRTRNRRIELTVNSK
jgi:outer membrane protein OmpA-like peptidoglycan-associated protein